MKKLTKIIVILSVMVMGCGASMMAQTAADVNETVKRMQAASTPCNGGPEAFSSFIAKFSTDRDFMLSRIKLSDAQRQEYASLLVPSNFTAMTPTPKDGEEWYQMWGELQFNKAYLTCGWVDSYTEYTFEFIRVNGKWYLGKVVL